MGTNRIKLKIDKILNRLFPYRNYLSKQKERSLSKYDGSFENTQENSRKKYLIDKINGELQTSLKEKALVIGCRNSLELDLLEEIGFKKVTGVDLFSFDSRVLVMDMHSLKFPDNQFDLVLMSHSLEHALDYNKVLNEVYRTLKSDAVLAVEVPVNYEVQGTDLHDFETTSKLFETIKTIMPDSDRLFAEDLPKSTENNFNSTDIARIIVRVRKD